MSTIHNMVCILVRTTVGVYCTYIIRKVRILCVCIHASFLSRRHTLSSIRTPRAAHHPPPSADRTVISVATDDSTPRHATGRSGRRERLVLFEETLSLSVSADYLGFIGNIRPPPWRRMGRTFRASRMRSSLCNWNNKQTKPIAKKRCWL